MANAAAVIPEPARAHASSWSRLLSPVDLPSFLDEYFGEKPLHVPGTPDKLADLFSWHDLNAILEEDVLSYPQLRLVRGGDLDPKLYFNKHDGHRRVDPAILLKEMSEGATLILRYCDRLVPTLREFACGLERELGASVHIDILAGCARVNALGTHWDEFECFNVQLSGVKYWKLYRPQRLYPQRKTSTFPLRDDVGDSPAPAAGDTPFWEASLKPGALIYVPRGWWHHVTPEELPSLHLSIAVEPPAGSDFLHWLADRLKSDDLVRMNIPYWNVEKRREFLDRLHAAVASQLNEEGLAAYLGHSDDTAVPRPAFGLPHSARAVALSLRASTRIRLQWPRKLIVEEDSARGTFRFRCKGQSFEFGSYLLPAFQSLNEGGAQTVERLSEGVPSIAVKAFILALSNAGLVSISEVGAL
jgi:ribosomal protein L16 Arg81 hydroxylase